MTSTGDVVLKAGELLGPAEIGILATVGVTKYVDLDCLIWKCVAHQCRRVPVYGAPVVGVLSTGDELVEPSNTPGPGYGGEISFLGTYF
jgi:gephyrin